MTDIERIPVIIGAGQVNDRPDAMDEGLDPLGLMTAALRAAEADAGCELLCDLESLAIVDQISFWQLGPLCAPLANAIGARPRINYQSEAPHGDTPVRLLHEAANRIGGGEVRLAAIAGGEALRTAAARAARGEQTGYDAVRKAAGRQAEGHAQRYGLTAPVDVYPLYENACRSAWKQTLAEAQRETATIWSLMSHVAAANDGAWIRKPLEAEDITRLDAGNRPIAFPYSKLMVANSAVNQGAAFLVASLGEARRRGIPDERLIHIGLGAAAKENSDILERDRFDRSASMEVSIRRTLSVNALTVEDLDWAELYSCFPCVPKMARRILGWPADRPLSVAGGLTFGGGPVANYMSHAIVAMVEKLRSKGRYGFLFANGGFATDNHCIILAAGAIPAARFPQDFDFQAEADALRQPAPAIIEEYAGEAMIETYTIFYDRGAGVRGGVIVARTPAGERTLARVDPGDTALIAFLTDGRSEPVGSRGRIARGEAGSAWTAA